MKTLTKKTRKERLKILLHKRKLTITDKQELLLEFQNHPSWTIKRGVGVVDIIRGTSHYGNRHFIIRRHDMSETDISYIKCVDGEPSKRQYIHKACRTAVTPTIEEAKSKVTYGKSKCPITNEVLYSRNTHIDHYDKKFVEVVDAWMLNKNEDEIYDKLNNIEKDMVMDVHFIDKRVEKEFILFHNQNTHLRAIQDKANLSLT